MKYWNKSKERRETWTIVTVHTDYSLAKRWCQQQISKHKFYCKSNKWYFEFSEDALAFKLLWDGKYRNETS